MDRTSKITAIDRPAGLATALIAPDVDTTTPSFADEAVSVMRRLRAALATLIDDAAAEVRKSRDLQKLLGIDSKLSWQIFKLAGPGEALSLAFHVPSPTSMRRLLQAAKDHGIGKLRIDEVRAAYDRFEQLVATHAGDRTSFFSMARGLYDSDETPKADLQHRKAIFQGYSHYFGMQLQTLAVGLILKPGSKPGCYDHASLRAKLGLRRLRPDADVIVDTVNVPAPTEPAPLRPEPVNIGAMEQYDAAILPQFCSQPPPQLHTTKRDDGTDYTELVGDAVGRRGSVDVVFGQVWRNAPLYATDDGEQISFELEWGITAPTGLITIDVLLHRPTFSKAEMDFFVYSAARGFAYQNRGMVKMPFRERIVRVGSAPDAALMREMPRYVELLEYMCGKLNWSLPEFDVYRVRIEYPLIDTVLNLDFKLPFAAHGVTPKTPEAHSS